MSTIPSPSPLTDLSGLDEIESTQVRVLPPPPVVQPLTDFELELRTRLTTIEGHQARTDRLVLELQRENRAETKQLNARIDASQELIRADIAALRAVVEGLPALLRKIASANGHG